MSRVCFKAASVATILGLVIVVPIRQSAHTTSSSPGGALSQNCTGYTLTPTIQLYPAAGGNGAFDVDTGAGGDSCTWNAIPTVGWISVDLSNHSGDLSLTYSVAANKGLSRNGAINIFNGGPVTGSLVATLEIFQDGVGVLICSAATPLTIGRSGSTVSQSFEMRDGLIITGGLLKVSADPFPDNCQYFLTSPSGIKKLIGTGRSATFSCPPEPYGSAFTDQDFVGQNAKGVWTLEIANPSTNTGRLLCWCLEIMGLSNGVHLKVSGGGGGESSGARPFDPVTITATVVADGSPVAGAEVTFQVHDTTTINPFPDLRGQSVTDTHGIASFAYDRADSAEDIITAQAQMNGKSLGEASINLTWDSQFGNCPSTQAMRGAPEADSTLSVLRKFRDDRLAQSALGKHYTELYYKFAPELVRLMIFNP